MILMKNDEDLVAMQKTRLPKAAALMQIDDHRMMMHISHIFDYTQKTNLYID